MQLTFCATQWLEYYGEQRKGGLFNMSDEVLLCATLVLFSTRSLQDYKKEIQLLGWVSPLRHTFFLIILAWPGVQSARTVREGGQGTHRQGRKEENIHQ